MRSTMMRLRPGLLAAFLTSTACGADIDVTAARRVWAALDEASIARPLDADYFRGTRLFRAPVRCEAGQGFSSVLQTQAWSLSADSDDGELTGNVAYTLHGCQTASKIAFEGKVRRTFHALQRAPMGTEGGMLRLTDEVFGTLKVSQAVDGVCEIDVTRVIVQGEARYGGSLCGHDASRLLSEGGAPSAAPR